jgi:prefoldin subunit 5
VSGDGGRDLVRDPTGCELRAAKLIDRLEARIAELERERDDLEEIIESRDVRIKELGDALASLAVREIHAQRRVRELEAAVDLAIAMQNERVDELDEANSRIRELEEARNTWSEEEK